MTLRVEITNTDPNDPEVWNKQGFVRKVLVDQVDYDIKNPQNGSPIPPFQSEILPGGTTGFYVWNGRRLLISELEVMVGSAILPGQEDGPHNISLAQKLGADWFDIGQFEVFSGKLKVTDPCYSNDTWCSGDFKAKNGIWQAAVLRKDEHSGWGIRNHRLFVMNSGAWDDIRNKSFFEKLNADIGVDSGQCGFWDFLYYAANQGGEYDEEDSFYGKACAATLGEGGAGIVGQGVAVSSGYGDGSYTCRVTFDDNDDAYAAELVFIDEDEEDEVEDEG